MQTFPTTTSETHHFDGKSTSAMDVDDCSSVIEETNLSRTDLRKQINTLKLQLARATQLLLTSNSEEAKAEVIRLKDLIALSNEVYNVMLPSEVPEPVNSSTSASVSSNATSSDNFDHTSRSNNTSNSFLVPSSLPWIQWKDHFFNRKAAVYDTPLACLDIFELVLDAHGLGLDQHWRRLIKPRLSSSMLAWLKTVDQSFSWLQFKEKVISKYGLSPAQEKAEAKLKLQQLRIKRNESINEYVDRFNVLREKANVVDTTELVKALLAPLPHALNEAINIHVLLCDDPNKDTVEYTIEKLKIAYVDYQSRHYLDKSFSTTLPSSPRRREDRQTRHAKPYDRNSSDGFPRKLAARPSNQAKPSSRKESPWCDIHKFHGHATADCRANALNNPGNMPTAPRTCYTCKKLWVPGHNCSSNASSKHNPHRKSHDKKHRNGYHSSSSGRHSSSTKHVRPPLVPGTKPSKRHSSTSSSESHSDGETTSSDIDMDEQSGDENLVYAAAALDLDSNDRKGKNKAECKYNDDYFCQRPDNFMSNDAIYLPLTVEKIKVWALLDSGCTFSAISPQLAKHLNLSIKKKAGRVMLAQKDVNLQRIGKTAKNLEVYYNTKTIFSKFEIFEIVNDLHVCIGMNLLPKLGIQISGLTYDWDEHTGPEIPVIDPEPYKPNDSPFGNPSERAQLLKYIQSSIDANKSIPPGAYCNLPDSAIILPIKKHLTHDTFKPQYPIAESLKPVVAEQIQKWKDSKIIERAPPNNPHNSPLLLVRKKNSQGEYTGNDYRCVIDSRLINKALDPQKIDRYPLPLISEMHSKMSKFALFSTIDLSACYHSFAIILKYRPLTAFTDLNGSQWMFSRAPFGLRPLSSRVQRILSTLFEDISEHTSVFQDDITVHTCADLQFHAKCVKEVINRLTKANLRMNVEKLHLAQRCIYILGFCLSEAGLQLDQRKVANCLNWPVEVKSSKELASRLGLINYFRESIPNIATLTASLNKLRNAPDIRKVWTAEHSEAMRKLQLALVSAPVLHAPNLNHPFHLVTDSSAVGIGCCLYQIIHNRIYYIGFLARSLTPCEQRWGIFKRELLAVVYAFTKYRQWLYGRPFHLYVDNKALLFLHTQEKTNRIIENFYETIYEFTFDITYCEGIKNILADRLSRLFDSPQSLAGAGSSKNENASKKSKSFAKESKRLNTTKETKHGKNLSDSKTSESNNLYICASHLDVFETPKSNQEKIQLLEKSHLLGHYGVGAMERIIHQDYRMHWPNLRDDITKFVKNCHQCRLYNPAKHVFHPPVSIAPNGVWQHLVMDLGTFNVTTPRGNNFILVVVDVFSRFTILRAIKDKTALSVATELVSIFSLFGYPYILGHDNGKEFSANLLQCITDQCGISEKLSLPFNPLGNSVAEATVKTTKRIIVKMLNGYDESWDLYVNSTALAMNCHYSRLHNMKPFCVMFFRQPNTFHNNYAKLAPNFPGKSIDQKAFVKKLSLVDRILIPAIKEQIERTQKADNAYFMKRHKILQKPFPTGSAVMIKNVEGKNSKTDPLYEGPYTICGTTKNGSYILKDRTDTLLARDVPTSHIKLIHDDSVNPEDSSETYEVQAIIDHRGKGPKIEYLTRWKHFKEDDDTWQAPETFDGTDMIKAYWARRNVDQEFNQNKRSTRKRVAPKSINKRRIPTRDDKSKTRKKFKATNVE